MAATEEKTVVTVEIPANIERSLSGEWPDLSRKVTEAIALEGYRQAALSQGQVGQMLGLNFWETEAFLKEDGAMLRYSEQDLEGDLRVLSALDMSGER
jgi:predicted HTH domain antitoxin